MSNKSAVSAMLQQSAKNWPNSFVSRKDVPKFTGGMISTRTLCNRDGLGTGPDGRFKLGKQVGYPVDRLVDWLLANYTE